MALNTNTTDCQYHVLVAVSRNGRALGYRILNLSSEYGPLTKELALRTLAADAHLVGQPWRIDAKIEPGDSGTPHMVLGAYALGESDRTGRPLATLLVPVENFAWVASRIMAQLNLDVEGSLQFQVTVLSAKHPLVAAWESNSEVSADFAVTSEPARCLHLPSLSVQTALPGPTNVMGGAENTWLRCLFSRRAFEDFRHAAQTETEREVSWAGLGEVFLFSDHCYVMIRELTMLPGDAGREWIRTCARDFAVLCREFGDRLCGYLHLHPRTVDGHQITPRPSANDAVVAWNFSGAVAAACVYPIALFGDESHDAGTDMAVYGYDKGLLTPVRWEVLQE